MTRAYTTHEIQVYTVHFSEMTRNRHYFKKGRPQHLF